MAGKKLDKKKLWLKNVAPAGKKSNMRSPKEDLRMPMHEYSEKTRIFSPVSRGI
ncbi:hypothetical protein AALA00_05100 [Lachnospiraceae bacterium 46-15]